ncbi:MAG: tyrosine-type recombinase/integrase [Gammaproteobacteria bacterium]
MLEGTPHLVVKLLYGGGLRITEALKLRVQDIDFDYKQPTVRSGKGDKDRVTTFPSSLEAELKLHLQRVKPVHQTNLDR